MLVKKTNQGCKGFTLIEVTVALAILAVILASVSQLVVNVINLAMLTRDKTEATALLQKDLAEATSLIKGCQNPTLDIIHDYPDSTGLNQKTVTTSFEPVSNLNNIDNFIKVTAVASWNLKGDIYNIQAVQYVRRPQ